MKLELATHLDRARSTVSEVDRIVSLHRYPGDMRTVMVRGLLATIIEHHRSILQLLRSGALDSAYALARDVVRGMRDGLWINASATEEQVLQVAAGEELPLSIPEMIKGIESVYGNDSFFEDLKNRWATQLYKYSRSDVVQLGRWHIDASSGLHSDDNEISEVVTISTLCVVILAAKFLANRKQSADSKKIEALATDYAAAS
jgi:hypothetical protein